MPRHPIFDPIFDAWWTERGVNPEEVRDMIAGRTQAPRALAEGLRAALGVPLDAWPRLEPVYSLKPKTHQTLPPVVHSATIGRMEPARAEPAPRRGQKIVKTKRPMAVAAKNSGMSIYAIAAKLGVPYSTAKSWGVKALPPDDKRKLLGKTPFSVPDAAWKI